MATLPKIAKRNTHTMMHPFNQPPQNFSILNKLQPQTHVRRWRLKAINWKLNYNSLAKLNTQTMLYNLQS